MTKPDKNLLANLNAQAIFEAAADAMLLIDDSGQVAYANPAALQLLEYSADSIYGLEVEALIPANIRSKHKHYREAFSDHPEKRPMGKGSDLFALSSSGKKLAVDIGLSPISMQKEKYVLVTFYLATQRRAAEHALQASEERLRLAKQSAGLGVFDFDARHQVVHWDERMCELWGMGNTQTVSYEDFLAVIHPEDRAARQAAIVHASDKNGNGEFKAEFRIINAQDATERWILTTGKMHFEDGHATRLIGVAQDITEHKKLEKTLQEQRAESIFIFKRQVAALAASAIAHELNQPLAAISAYSEVALHELNNVNTQPEKLKRALEGCVTQAQRAGTSLHELLAFLHEGKLVVTPFDLNLLVKDALNIAKSDGYKEFQAKVQLEPKIPFVLANRSQVQKVLVNLLRNAVEAMRGAGLNDGDIVISVQTDQQLNMAHVSVQDSGPGVDADKIKRIFEPFFTTKSTGIGMGLAISRALIESNGGQLWLAPNSSANIGASFHFTLPFTTKELS